jgi:phage tail-like protein
VRRWTISRAWPAKYESSPLHARGNEVVIETLELACEGVEIED